MWPLVIGFIYRPFLRPNIQFILKKPLSSKASKTDNCEQDFVPQRGNRRTRKTAKYQKYGIKARRYRPNSHKKRSLICIELRFDTSLF